MSCQFFISSGRLKLWSVSVEGSTVLEMYLVFSIIHYRLRGFGLLGVHKRRSPLSLISDQYSMSHE